MSDVPVSFLTDTAWAPWYVAYSDDKRRARLNIIRHLLGSIPYKDAPQKKIKLPKRSNRGAYDDTATLEGRNFVRDSSGE